MRLIDEISPTCEEFLDLIQNYEDDCELQEAVDSLREFLGKVADGYIHLGDQKLAYAIQNRLEEIYKLVPNEEKDDDPLIGDSYDCALNELEQLSGYAAAYSDVDDPDEDDQDYCDDDSAEEDEW